MVKLEQDSSSCPIGPGTVIVASIKTSKGDIPIYQITREDGEELRCRSKKTGARLHGMPVYWWKEDDPAVIQLWPAADREYDLNLTKDDK